MDSRDLRNLEEEYKKISGSAEQLDENPILDFLSKMSPPASQSANPNVRSGVRTPGLVNKGNPIPRQGDLAFRIQRALPRALADIPRAIPAQLSGKNNEASLRQQARAQKLMTLLRTGKIDDTIKPGQVGTTGAANNNNRGGNLLKGLSIGPGGFNINGKPVSTTGSTGGGGAPKGTSPANATTAQKIQGGLKTYAQQRTTNPAAAKATGDAVFKLANPRIAAANAERARIRGTFQTDNPLMKDLRSKLPQPTAKFQDPKLKKAVGKTSGYQSLLNNPAALRTPPPALKSDVDMFDIVKGHLISEGATEKEALKRMVSMTEQEINTILQNINI